MKQYLKYDLKSNRKFFASTFMVFAIFFLSLMSVRLVGNVSKLVEINSAIYSLEIILGLVLIMVLIWFIFSSFYKEFYTKRSTLTFSLPLSISDIILTKILVINLFYLVLAGFVIFINVFLGNFDLELLLRILLLLFFIVNFLSQLILFAISIDRFKGKRLFALSSLLIFFLAILLLILILGFGEGRDFLGGFSNGYFFVLSLVLFFVNKKYMKENFDLS